MRFAIAGSRIALASLVLWTFASVAAGEAQVGEVAETGSERDAREASSEEDEGWEALTNGEDFEGWKVNESEESWSVEDGAFVAKGPRSHLFYVGPDGLEHLKPFKNFELMVDVMTKPNSNGGIFFHTQWQDEGWPAHGYECQVNVSQGDPVKTGSIYNTVKLYKDDIAGLIEDNKWWKQHIIVRGKRVVVKLNDKEVLEYMEPDDKEGTVRLGEGTFALQAHDPESTVYFKNIRVKRLPDHAEND